jgi:mono/diheme cytochrome c family protein
MRTRLAFLVMTVSVAIVAVACGRASKEEIDAALGITPTATFSAEQVISSTAEAASVAATRQAAIAALASPQGADVDLASAGDVTQGRLQYQLRCQQCHQPSGNGPAAALSGPGNPATTFTDAQLRDLVRTGEGHAKPPGPLNTTAISDRQLINIIAFIRDQSK